LLSMTMCKKGSDSSTPKDQLPAAIAAIDQYRAEIDDSSTYAYYFDKAFLAGIITQPGAAGIRVYNALSATGKKDVLVVGTDKKGNELLTAPVFARNFNAVVLAESMPCPVSCSPVDPDPRGRTYIPSGAYITIQAGKARTTAFKAAFPNEHRAYNFSKAAIEQLLKNDAVAGIRIYRGRNTNGQLTMIIMGADQSFADPYNSKADGGIGVITDPMPCPLSCGTTDSKLKPE
jgi:hypothetical protein